MKSYPTDKIEVLYNLIYGSRKTRLENYKKYLKDSYKLTDQQIRILIKTSKKRTTKNTT